MHAIIAIAAAITCSLVVTGWRSAEHRTEAAEARAHALTLELLAKDVELARCQGGSCGPPPRGDERERAKLEALKQRLHELQCAQRKAKLEAAFAKNDPVAWILDDVGGDIRTYRDECTPDDPRVEQLARRFEESTHDTGTSLDHSMIQAGIATVRRDVFACGAHAPATGQVKLHVQVAPDGHPSSVTIGTTPDVALGDCVRDAVARARFTATDHGGSFSYPFVF